jgi:hypothetical protein
MVIGNQNKVFVRFFSQMYSKCHARKPVYCNLLKTMRYQMRTRAGRSRKGGYFSAFGYGDK